MCKRSVGYLSVFLTFVIYAVVGDEMPESFSREGKMADMYHYIYSGHGHVDGLASKWDFENLRWKE